MLKKQKILFLLHVPPPVHGSAIVGEIIKESALINENYDCSYINLLASYNLEETGKVSSRKILRVIRTWFNLLTALLIQKPNLCYLAITTTGFGFYKDILLITLIKLFGKRIVYHLHNKGVSKNQNNILKKLLYKYSFKRVEVILLSFRLYSDISDFVSKDKIHICPNGISANNGSGISVSKELKKIPEILFLSNLIESKGVIVLLEACQLLMKKGILFNCTFIGDESDISAQRLKKLIDEWGLTNRISYMGKKYGEEKGKAYKNADIFAFPTYYKFECFPLVVLEAMQFSKPVISTFEGGIPDEVEDGVTGFLVPQRDKVNLADKLEILIRNPELRLQMGTAGRKKFMNEFTLEIFESRLLNIINLIAEK